MGRASRGKSRLRQALQADNQGNRWRKVIARDECLVLLTADLRIQECFSSWVPLQEQRARTGPPAWIHSDADLQRAMAAHTEREIDALAGVLQRMGVPWRWCAEVLITVSFPVMRHNALHPDDLRAVMGEFGSLGTQADSRLPRHDGQDVKEWVRWWYRRNVKHPPDELHVLVDEYAKREKRVTEAHSVVQNGITRAETLLNVGIRPSGQH